MAIEGNWFVVVNPEAGNGQVKKEWPFIKTALEAAKLQFDFKETEHHKHGVQITKEAIKLGYTKIVAVGGDGTIHNVVNGIMQQNLVGSSSIFFGVIPVGTGNDWIKTHGIPKDINKAIAILVNGNTKLQDIGKISNIKDCFSDVYFNNLAGVGFDGYVVKKIGSFKRFGATAYILGAIAGILSAKNFNCQVSFNQEMLSVKSLMVLIGICKYSGGGMQLTSLPEPADGLFDISIAQDFSTFDLLKNIPRLFNGSITKNKKVITKKVASIIIEIADEQLPFVQADGELIGAGNLKVSICNKALRFYCQ